MSLAKRLKRLYTAPMRFILNAQMKSYRRLARAQSEVLFRLCNIQVRLRRQRTMRDPAFSQKAMDECVTHMETLKKDMGKTVGRLMVIENRMREMQ